ncbi:ICP0-binding domain of ubiquitin-specific protease 7 [Gigaspora rosea]|uniref:ICP0-binding domain of ubiquitin-specific protease 7 n=1 Tax=Gigaspora rosea TaxID=44941 RepID=A0A397UNW3_9GLOM|nr:ICP0-binding domain of ubiquitin-specific protease 7 [Gigaspora rosea]
MYIKKPGIIYDIIPILCEKKEFPPHTPLIIYKEVQPNMIRKMDPNLTFQQAEIKNGDIICFQKTLITEKSREFIAARRICDIPAFYKSLSTGIVVQFKPKYKDREPNVEFELVLSKRSTYNYVVKHVAAHLYTDPLKLRFTTIDPIFGTHKVVIKKMTTQSLSAMIETTNRHLVKILYYEIL